MIYWWILRINWREIQVGISIEESCPPQRRVFQCGLSGCHAHVARIDIKSVMGFSL